MLQIRKEQYQVFEAARLKSFINEMIEHAYEFSPILCKVVGEPQVRAVVGNAVEKARGYQLINRGPVRLYIEMSFLFGSAFDSDPQYFWAAKILNRNTLQTQTQNAEELYEKVLDYLEKVCGPENAYTRAAVQSLSRFVRASFEFTEACLAPELFSQIQRLYPQKFQYIGEPALRLLIDKGVETGRSYDFQAAQELVLIVILMFVLGHGCTNDPLYPWIAATLKDPLIADTRARAKRLENKSLTWLDHVFATDV